MSVLPQRDELGEVASLLRAVFDNPKFRSPTYLSWLYEEGCDGPAVYRNFLTSEGVKGHYCLVPQRFRHGERTMFFGESLNLAVASEVRRQGVFLKLAEQTHRIALEDNGLEAVIAVTNKSSTPGFLRSLGFNLVMQLPVRLGLRPLSPSRDISSREASREFIEGQDFAQLCEAMEFNAGPGWEQVWDGPKLRWRLSSPISRYMVHANGTAVAITTSDTVAGIPVTVLLKIFGLKGAERTRDVRPLLSAACRAHGTFFYVYAGFNRTTRIPGIPVPRRFLRSPLNLIYRPLGENAPEGRAFEVSVYEFLDFDAY